MTKQKPQMKKEVAVTWHYEPLRQIRFYATEDAVTEFYPFGQVDDDGQTYLLTVDARYIFEEVLEYIQNYG